jgi:hypothetical protein
MSAGKMNDKNIEKLQKLASFLDSPCSYQSCRWQTSANSEKCVIQCFMYDEARKVIKEILNSEKHGD